ncbi:phosphodiester glycosidase family protein [Nocardioides sp. cx-173]|uniref:phosphodiester glycosidase family protein n=1 Tax=Nocardioides sp. cx-173 TaxID=2898796 RepID=UPI001E32A7B9|nr:phosphodiester glycosidase family protein [Nocardioides sp. cx-173]MCD4526749.1 phosphodiester glycosidase family protein [Nocardioides sp. cx-173]UGB42509.1 phosphodiester glycosidase family protein [Nocardioides sp. cx-173]
MRTRLPQVAALLLGCTLLAAPSPSVGGGPDDPRRPGVSEVSRVPQTSDGVRGEIAAPLPGPSLRRATRELAPPVSWRVAPGITYSRWDQLDARGPVRAHLLTVDPKVRGVNLGYGSPGAVRRTDEVSDILARHDAIAGVNGDFFDIGDTGAPLGIGRSRLRGLLHGPRSGWNSAFFLDAKGRPDIGPLTPALVVAHRPGLVITNVNSPSVQPDGIGLYTSKWGRTSGYRVTDGVRTGVRMVRVVKRRVVEVGTRLPVGTPVRGQLLIGRGAGATRLAALRPGSWVTVRGGIAEGPQMAITGNRFLVRDGVMEVVDDRELHPRTAVGIDRDTGQVLLLVIDGRQDFSRGHTMVELAELMIELGADEALNLDGGGSTTMVAPGRRGAVGVRNSPSDGAQRQVANAIEVTYTRPRRP